MKDFHPKSTKSMRAVSANMVLAECCEADCRIPILVEQEDQKEVRCMSCLMKHNLRAALNK